MKRSRMTAEWILWLICATGVPSSSRALDIASPGRREFTQPPPVPSLAQEPAQRQTVTLRGVVRDEATNKPLSNVMVRLQATKQVAITDQEGKFRFSGVEPGRHELYVSAVNYALRKQDVDATQGDPGTIVIALTSGSGGSHETMEVVAMPEALSNPAGQILRGSELQNLSGGIVDDPMRAVQALPGVTASDDLRCEFAVRGSGFRNIGISFEGVATSMLMHLFQREDTGSVSMINSDVLEGVSLMNGAYPQRYGDRIGAWLDYTLREGSREAHKFRILSSLSSTSGIAEGPLDSSGKGSFLAAFRYNYVDKLLRRFDATSSAFGFIDSQGKLVYDVSARHQVQMSWLIGRAKLDNEHERLTSDINDDWKSNNQTGLVTLAWRTLFSPRFMFTHRIAAAAGASEGVGFFENDLVRETTRELSYRGDAVWVPDNHATIEAGIQVRQRFEIRRDWIYGWTGPQGGPFEMIVWKSNSMNGHTWRYSAYGLLRWQASPSFLVSPGMRVDRDTLTQRTVSSPWLQMEWKPASNWKLSAGTGVYQQFPAFNMVLGWQGGGMNRLPERAWHADFGLARQIGGNSRIQVTAYNRQERDILRLRNGEAQLFNGQLILPFAVPGSYRNLLRGYSRGLEFQLRRENPNGLSGWLSYTLSYTRYRDYLRHEQFWGDFDQRHTFNAFGQYRFSPRTSISARFRYGSSFPIAGYYEKRGEDYYLADRRNLERLPTYARMDLRANRTFNLSRYRLSFFVEVLNLFSRYNYRVSESWIDDNLMIRGGLLDKTIPILPSVGILFEF